MAGVEIIRIEGLKEFRRDLRKLDRKLPRAIRKAGNEAAKIVVQSARPRVPHRTGRAAGSMRVASSQTSAAVSAGGRSAPYYPWLDFGGAVGRHNSVYRPFLKVGRYIWPAFLEHRAEIEHKMRTELAKIADESGLGPAG